ncbi:MAG: mannose-1-phosphate guanylyltransferase [Bacteroidia bacterium]|nr:mannose-1-phosphate guanylyltransferase [Bacteroidia bacterium]
MKKGENNYAVIMAGGIGSRFWPLSKKNYPKQFHDILGVGKSLLRLTYDRFAKFFPKENIYVVTNNSYSLLVHDHIPELPFSQIMTEPAAMNTAPCVAYAAFKLLAKNPEANCVIAPSDHLILDEDAFRNDILNCLDFTSHHNSLLTLGIKPNRPDTGYGYIQYHEEDPVNGIHKVKTFTEKPDLNLAQTFLDSGDFLWNSGIFIWKAQDILAEFELLQSDMYALFKKGMKHYNTPEETAFINKIYPQCKSISIDYGIMEKAKNVHIVPADFGWSDLGTWKSLYDLRNKDENQNVLHGKVMVYNTSNSLVVSEGSSEKLIVVDGLENAIVIDTPEVLLISSLEKEQEVRQIVTDLREMYKGKYS